MKATAEERAIVIFDDAVKVIKEYGWTQGQAGNERIGYCLLGSIWKARMRVKARADAQKLTITTLIEVLDEPALATWNDDPKRTKRQVLAALRKASKRLHLKVTS